MTKKIDVGPDGDEDDVPDWVNEDSPIRSTPYSEEELDLLVEGTVQGIRDTAAWTNLVQQVGEEEARRVLRARLIMMDENVGRLPRH